MAFQAFRAGWKPRPRRGDAQRGGGTAEAGGGGPRGPVSPEVVEYVHIWYY